MIKLILPYMETERLILKQQPVDIYTPVKRKKGGRPLDLFQKLFSTAVSRIRQPIESLFNWIHQKTHIQSASKVRAFSGLQVHIFGKIAAALFLLIFNP